MTPSRRLIAHALCLSVVLATAAAAAAQTRQLKYPPKTRRTLWTDAEIAQARANIQKYPQARKLADDIVKSADYWIEWSDADLVALITDSRVPRAFETGTAGCPSCGHELYQKHTQYGWKIDPRVPFKVTCPVDGSIYPSNDYAGYYRSDFKEKKGWDSGFVDDGWGWPGPNGEKYWFVAYWNHWVWHRHITPGVRSLGRAYLLTGDNKYAHKAVVMLHRIAEVYPAMDHAKQSRYGAMMAARGVEYRGKVVNNIWECGIAENITEAYDDVWQTIESDEAAQKLFGKNAKQIREFIEANFLEDAIDAVFSAKIRGNFGMHQNTLVYLGIVREFGETEKWFDELLKRSDSNPAVLGLNYALYNMISRDGLPTENAPGYNFIWVQKVAEYGDLLHRMGRNVFEIPKTRRLFDGVLDQIVVTERTPCIGDSGSVWGDLNGRSSEAYQAAYRHYKLERYARWLAQFGAGGADGFKSFESLLYPPIEASVKLGPQKSRLLDGYGQAILNNHKDSVALSLCYGLKFGHGHFDRLNIDIFSAATPVTPDLGYPDAMNEFVKGIYTWSKNTISHNTVTVDAAKQPGNVHGTVKLFADSPFARVVDVEAAGTYPQCSSYRRAIVMVDVDEDRSYYVDFFTVAGGKQHDYSLHGPPGKFQMTGGEWSEPEKGTLAGREVPLGYAYDAPAFEGEGYAAGFSGYGGSGFQHLFNVRHHRGGEWAGQWEHLNVKEARLRIRVLEQPGQQLMLCDARVSPVKHPEILKYLIARRTGEGVKSQFVSVIEPFTDKPFIKGVHRAGEQTITIRVEREDGLKDHIVYSTVTPQTLAQVITHDGGGKVVREFFAGPGGKATGVTGVVTTIEPTASVVRVKLNPSAGFDAARLVGRVVQFKNNVRQTSHPIVASRLEGEDLVLSLSDDLLVGKVRVDSVQEDGFTTGTAMPLAPLYPGTTLANARYEPLARVVGVDGGKVHAAGKIRASAGDDLWFINIAPGDHFEAPAIHWSN